MNILELWIMAIGFLMTGGALAIVWSLRRRTERNG